MMGPGGWGPGWHQMGGYGYDQRGYYGNLSEQEMQKLDQQRAEFFKATEILRQQLYEKELDLNNELVKENPDTSKASSLQSEISKLQSELDQKRLDYEIQARKTAPNYNRGYRGYGHMMGDGHGEYDVPLVIQDRTFDHNNQLIYMTGHPMEQMTGFLGDLIMVNGMPDFTLPISTNAYRLRLLNGSNSRIYRLAWQDDRPLTVIGADGGFLARPVQRRYAFLSPGERLEIWADFRNDPVGFETALISLPFDGGTTGHGMMMGRG
jgi:hypothetical protein